MMAVLQENLNAMRVVKAFHQEKVEIDKFEEKNEDYRAVPLSQRLRYFLEHLRFNRHDTDSDYDYLRHSVCSGATAECRYLLCLSDLHQHDYLANPSAGQNPCRYGEVQRIC